MRYLGLDIGVKRCGIAISDKTNLLATPYKTVSYNYEDYQNLANIIDEIIKLNNITDLVIGMPINMDGTKGFAAKRSEGFKDYLKTETINIHYIDERLTTVSAMNILHENGKNEKNGKKVIDTLSACLILEIFMKRIENEKGK